MSKKADYAAELSGQELRFARAYARSGNGAAAAREAGYEKHERQTARRLLQKPTINYAIQAIRKQTEAERAAQDRATEREASRTRTAALDKAWGIVESMSENDPAEARVALQALERLAKSEGWDTPEQRIVTVREEIQRELAAALLEAARIEVGEEMARRIVLRLAGQPVEQPLIGG